MNAAMATGSFRFDRFTLDPADRRLCRDGAPVELSGRYLDALVLLVRQAGRLVSKDHFLDEVWRGVPVTDEALTQCIKALRRQLGDDAAAPRFIETVPRHGYRFIAPVDSPALDAASGSAAWRDALLVGAAGTVGAGLAGLGAGIFYGFAGASQPLAPAMGAISMLLVLACLGIVAGLIGGAGVAFGIAGAALAARSPWRFAALGGAAGGLVVGAIGKLIGLDAFTLLLGRSPGDIAGAGEGLLLGAAVGLGGWIGARSRSSLRRSAAIAGLVTAAAGVLVALLGGRLLGGSLDLLSKRFTGSALSLDRIGALFGEAGFGPASRMATGALEGLLFGGCIVGAMLLARRQLGGR